MAKATIKIVEPEKVRKIYEVGSFRSKISYGSGRVKILDELPFRVRFTSIQIPGFSNNNVPGIGVQIIGYSNYIL